MKYKKKLKKLESRIKDYEQTVAKTKKDAQGFKKPGSINK